MILRNIQFYSSRNKQSIAKYTTQKHAPKLELPQVKSVFSTQEFIRAFRAQPPTTRFYIALGFLLFSLAGIQATSYIEQKIPVPKHQEEVLDLGEETRKQLEKELD